MGTVFAGIVFSSKPLPEHDVMDIRKTNRKSFGRT
jgi:hypothetical protein